MKNSTSINPTIAPNGRVRGPIEQALLQIAAKNDLAVTETSFEEAARAKGESRRRDAELIRTGQATPQEIQEKNSFFTGSIEILDWSPLFSSLDEAQT